MGWNTQEPPRSSLSNRLTFEIWKFPPAYVPPESEPLTKLDDKRFVIDVTEPRKYKLKFAFSPLFIIMPFLVLMLFLEMIAYEFSPESRIQPASDTLGIYIGFTVLAASLTGIILLIQWLQEPNQLVIFDRMAQTVTLPRGLRRRPRTYPFEKMVPVVGTTFIASVGMPTSVHFSIKPPPKSGGSRLPEMITLDNDPWKTWSFIVWYMDKNRPLPPSPALDPYREADRKRREAEGNPEPYARMHPGVLQELQAYNESRIAKGLEPIEELTYDSGYQQEDDWSRYYGGR